MAKKQREEEWREFIQVHYDVDEVRKINETLPNAYIPFKVSWKREFFQDMTPEEVGKAVLAAYEFWETGKEPDLESRDLRFVLKSMDSYLQTMLGTKFRTGCENGKRAALVREIRKLKERGVSESAIMKRYPEYQPPNATSRHVTPRNNNQLSISTSTSTININNQQSISNNQLSTATTTTSVSSCLEGVSDSEGEPSPSTMTDEEKYGHEISVIWGKVFGGFTENENNMIVNRIEKFGVKATCETLKGILQKPNHGNREEVQTELFRQLQQQS